MCHYTQLIVPGHKAFCQEVFMIDLMKENTVASHENKVTIYG